MDEDKQKVTLAQSVRELRENIPAMIELTKLNAQITRVKYLALVEQGFSTDQALKLCQQS
jgi:hypothetical protein